MISTVWFTRRRAAISAAAAITLRTAASRCAASTSRMSISRCACRGTLFTTPGDSWNAPVVPTESRVPASASASTLRASSAPASPASLRRYISCPPAWPPCP